MLRTPCRVAGKMWIPRVPFVYCLTDGTWTVHIREVSAVATLSYTVDAAIPPERVLAALTDFSDRRRTSGQRSPATDDGLWRGPSEARRIVQLRHGAPPTRDAANDVGTVAHG